MVLHIDRYNERSFISHTHLHPDRNKHTHKPIWLLSWNWADLILLYWMYFFVCVCVTVSFLKCLYNIYLSFSILPSPAPWTGTSFSCPSLSSRLCGNINQSAQKHKSQSRLIYLCCWLLTHVLGERILIGFEVNVHPKDLAKNITHPEQQTNNHSFSLILFVLDILFIP